MSSPSARLRNKIINKINVNIIYLFLLTRFSIIIPCAKKFLMRLWSIHPKYLDTKGLVAVWREGLLAKKVLEGKTKGYKNHPQLIRFIDSEIALESINQYLYGIYKESTIRKYNFDKSKLYEINSKRVELTVNTKQIEYEFELLKSKLKKRDLNKYNEMSNITVIELHPIFIRITGDIENWEKIIPEIINNIQ